MSAHTGHGSVSEAEVVPRAERVDGFDAIAEEWEALAARGAGIFATATWNRVWWKHFGKDRELLLHAVRRPDGALVAVLPLYAWRARWPRVVRFLGHGPGDELGPVHGPDDRALAARWLQGALDRLSWDVFFGEQLPGPDDWSALLGGGTWRRESSPVLELPTEGWTAYLESRSANFRQQLRRRERALSRAGSVRVRLSDETTLERDLDTLFALHRARWRDRTTDFSDTPFHRELAREALERGWLRLRFLELDGRPVAAWHGFQVGPVTSYYQAGRDPVYDRLSVGFVLMAHTIQAAIEEGAREYRFGRGDEAFKSRFTDLDPGLETVTLTRGPVGAAAFRGAHAARRIRQTLRLPASPLACRWASAATTHHLEQLQLVPPPWQDS